MNLGEINHFLGLPDFKADIMQKEAGESAPILSWIHKQGFSH